MPLPFQNTRLYQNSLEVSGELMQLFAKNEVFQQKIGKEMLDLATDLAKALEKNNDHEQQQALETIAANLTGMLAILEIAEKSSMLTSKEKNYFSEKISDLQKQLVHFQLGQKRILILSSNAGQGHMSASKAIKQGFEYLYGYDFRVEIVDFAEVLSSFFNKATLRTYEGSIKYVPSVYEFLYESTNTKWSIKLLNLLNYPFQFNKLKKFFSEKKPDLILSTHPVWDYIAMKVWKKQSPSAKFLSLITDSIHVHEAWVTADTDFHLVPNEDTALTIRKLGVETDKIKILGFPVQLKFLEKSDRKSLLEEFNLNPKFFTIIYLATSENKQKATLIIEECLKTKGNFNLIVVTGRNGKLLPKLEPYKNLANVRIFGWTDKLADFIKTCDIVITKAGGATVMECIAAQKPMIITQIIPGQEQGNAELIERYQLGIISAKSNITISQSVEEIRKKHTVYEKNLATMSNPRAALDIAEFVEGILKK